MTGLAAARLGTPARAARLLGAADALRERNGFVLLPLMQAWQEQGTAAARAALGETAFAAAWAEGSGWDMARAVEEASTPAAPRGGGPPLHRRPGHAHAPLTPREWEVARLIAEGLTNAEIAARLVVSERTAEAHAEHIRDKLGLRTRAELIRYAQTHGLLAPGATGTA
jgi:DNA-binding NarL/FixJ family response regulator